ncbi:U1 zinc finger family protein [Loa loa]|uniref:U1 zinc finger family protein n=1 Tax=Loa loa TaxID=7209 RepID=A0A1I7V9G3_LOALO|nr:U1 zinc finger family protein [Loa loa]EFO22945.1 U1 zinc finger family protein [Loa loa]
MTDVWKSNARRFCEICKVWFADNRVSIEHHEGGQKHKAAIQAKLRELGKQNKQKEKEQSDLQVTLAMMESAASKSMGIGDSCPSAGIVGPMPKPKKYMDPRAHSASIAEMARQMAQHRKEQELKRTKVEHKAENEKSDPESETVWVEARADNGALYYFHMYSGVTVWEQPQNYYTAEQYAMKLAMMENKTDAMAKNQVTEPNKLKSEPRRHWGQQETSGVCKMSKIPQTPSQNETKKAIPEEQSAEVPSNVQHPSSCQSTAMNEVRGCSSEKLQITKFDPEMDAANFVVSEYDIPLPPSSQDSEQEKIALNLTVKEEPLEENNCDKHIQGDYSNAGEESIDVKNETQEGITEKIVEQKEPPRLGPYGPWVPVEKVPEKPKVDWELPIEEQGRKRTSESLLPPEDIITFSGKSAMIKRKKINGPIEFRKRKTTIKIRQPIDDQ